MDELAIGDYALLSDCRSAALVSRDGSVDWLCFPRFDSPSVFCRLLDPSGGHFAIRPAGQFQASRRYLGQTMVLETTFTTPRGTAVLTDALAIGPKERGHEMGAHSPSMLVRRLTCSSGEIEAVVTYSPKPEYGLINPALVPVRGGIAALGAADRLLLAASVSFDIDGPAATARIPLTAGQTIGFSFGRKQIGSPARDPWTPDEIAARLDDTVEGWRSWSAIHQAYDGPWRELVHHSGRVLKALTYAPTGVIVAAPTTSLPETIGGGRNWDYRFTWVRDASLTMAALWVAACPDEANRFFGFLADAAAAELQRGGDLQIMFGIGGERDLTERELPHLAGWRGSRPVRVGNDAWTQRQLDVYGELLEAAQRLVDQLGELDPVIRRFFGAAADTAASRWRQKDRGIWEIRGEPQDFLHSKLMCWVALDRAIALASYLDAEDRITDWAAARDEIRSAILTRGWNERVQSFTQVFGGDDLDATGLMLAITGFLPADDPRMIATIDATAQRLTDERGLVYRYLAPDGLAEPEGTFLLCTFWLAQAQALAGQVDAATATFERAVAGINDVGLLAEEVDPGTGEMIGNFPQAFSHVGLINAAWAIAQAQQRTAGTLSGKPAADGSGAVAWGAVRRTYGFGIVLAGLAGMGALAGLAGLIAVNVPGAQAGAARPAMLAKLALTEPTASHPRALPDFGNPNGHFPVPAAGRAVDTSHPNHVIGRGTPASCTSAAVVRAVASGGIIRFNCGRKPVTIVMRATARVPKTRRLVVLDGGGLVTLSGGGKRRILFSDTCAGTWSTGDCVNQPYPEIVVQNITFADGFDGTHQATCTANAPRCWYGGVDGGGAIYVEGGQFKAVNSRFTGDRCYRYGPDLGGGAIRVLAQFRNRPVYITSDTFSGGRCSNGAALSSISVQWDVLNSVFTSNQAIGWGANPASNGTPGGGSGGAIYNDGTDYNTLIAGTIMRDNTAREGGGAVFYVVDSGWGKLTLNESHLHHNPSGQFQTFAGIYDDIDGHDGPPVMIHSTDN